MAKYRQIRCINVCVVGAHCALAAVAIAIRAYAIRPYKNDCRNDRVLRHASIEECQ